VPTDTDFEQAARTFRLAAELVGNSRRELGLVTATRAVGGGSVAAVVDAAVAVVGADTDEVGRRIDALADLCERRALVCAEHAAELARWRIRYDAWERAVERYRMALDDPTRIAASPGSAPPRPIAPASWVEPR
jgi:hypothetical protein